MRRLLLTPIAVALLTLVANRSPLAAQAAASPVAKAEDVRSVDAVVQTLYAVISGPIGQKRDWDRFRSLFAPGARLIPTGRDPAGKPRVLTWTPEDYVTTAGGNLEKNGFFEREINRTSDQFGKVVHLFSTYESRRTVADEKPFARGINSIQLFDDGTRWWIVTVFWEQESAANPIPAKYLKP